MTVLLYVLGGVLLTLLVGLALIGLWALRDVWKAHRQEQADAAAIRALFDRAMSARTYRHSDETRH